MQLWTKRRVAQLWDVPRYLRAAFPHWWECGDFSELPPGTSAFLYSPVRIWALPEGRKEVGNQHSVIKYPGLEGTYKNHWVQLWSEWSITGIKLTTFVLLAPTSRTNLSGLPLCMRIKGLAWSHSYQPSLCKLLFLCLQIMKPLKEIVTFLYFWQRPLRLWSNTQNARQLKTQKNFMNLIWSNWEYQRKASMYL